MGLEAGRGPLSGKNAKSVSGKFQKTCGDVEY